MAKTKTKKKAEKWRLVEKKKKRKWLEYLEQLWNKVLVENTTLLRSIKMLWLKLYVE